MQAAELKIWVDEIGNTIGLRQGLRPNLPPIVVGSHLDTVIDGGKYDGTVGVVAGLEIMRALADLGLRTQHPLQLIAFACEEATRFGEGGLGSQAWLGNIGEAEIALRDTHGTSLGEAMTSLGLSPAAITSRRDQDRDITAYLELHVEQSDVLESLNRTIGLVHTIAAPTRLAVVLEGEPNHSGSTPMGTRKDALAAAAEIILAVEEIASHRAGPDTVGTVGFVEAFPGSYTVVPGRVQMGIEIRDTNTDNKHLAVSQVFEAIEAITGMRGIQSSVQIVCDRQPQPMSGELLATAAGVCDELGITYHRMHSGAGHDAQHVAQIAPSALLFVPSAGGISHRFDEFTGIEHIVSGTCLLAVLALTIDGAFSRGAACRSQNTRACKNSLEEKRED
jgi:N-carbamoyl-L-amino-acid hydrolase